MADLRARLAQATGFQWDSGNATKNWTKHTVGQSECEQVFFNAPLVLAADPAHSAREGRYFALGQTDEGRLLLVVFTLRGSLVRVISARPMSRREREVYADAEGQEDAK
ncbi:BrnT family toxin [Roseisolibacter sp. H3M3-2]|uniref:BrnT family toxin n=1 Tax=Roseisolibacter sp. H3M3-2 TaxID=3031323 RepID=UPI0023DBD9F4|nr:BrnT family toxin [Roseisolibacter sp. H3M3-2]MDF1501785.1 BrnT family toxin [Roseisolibacter sp. H3M3-2]